MSLPHKTAKRKGYGDGNQADMRIVGAYLPRLETKAKEPPVKLPLTFKPHGTHTSVIIDADSSGLAIVGNDVAAELVALANAHAAQPGAPREDGVYVVQLKNGHELIVKRNMGAYYVGDPFHMPGMESQIVCYRKHKPLEVPNG